MTDSETTLISKSDASVRDGARRPAFLVSRDRDTEGLFRSALDALSAHVAVLDESGTIVAVNKAWRSFAISAGYADANHGVGVNYLAVCERGAAGSEDAARTAVALRGIMAGERETFRMEYPCTGPDGPRWFQVRVTCAASTSVRRIVVAHEDITDVKEAEDALARLNGRLLKLQDEERRRIARELHDTTAQNLLVISLSAARLQDHRRTDSGSVMNIAGEILQLAEQSLQEIRTLAYVLHPPLLDDVGLESALRWLAKGFGERSGIAVEAWIDEIGIVLSREISTTLFRVAQEALVNVHRHSGSPWARVTLGLRSGAVVLEVMDRGRGLVHAPLHAGDAPGVGVGISGMRVRVEQLGGRLELQSEPSGLRVTATVPLVPPRSAPISELP